MSGRVSTWMRVIWLALVLAVAFVLPARADAPLRGAEVRIQAFSIEIGWHEGRVARTPEGCTVVRLRSPTADGHSQVALAAIDWLEVRREGSWSYVLVEPLLAHEPAKCRAESASA